MQVMHDGANLQRQRGRLPLVCFLGSRQGIPFHNALNRVRRSLHMDYHDSRMTASGARQLVLLLGIPALVCFLGSRQGIPFHKALNRVRRSLHMDYHDSRMTASGARQLVLLLGIPGERPLWNSPGLAFFFVRFFFVPGGFGGSFSRRFATSSIKARTAFDALERRRRSVSATIWPCRPTLPLKNSTLRCLRRRESGGVEEIRDRHHVVLHVLQREGLLVAFGNEVDEELLSICHVLYFFHSSTKSALDRVLRGRMEASGTGVTSRL
jgi:hypothetical protein